MQCMRSKNRLSNTCSKGNKNIPSLTYQWLPSEHSAGMMSCKNSTPENNAHLVEKIADEICFTVSVLKIG